MPYLPAGNINPGRIVEFDPLAARPFNESRIPNLPWIRPFHHTGIVRQCFDEFMETITDRIDEYFDRIDTFYSRLFRTKVVTQVVSDSTRLDSLGRQIPVMIDRRMIGFIRHYDRIGRNHIYLSYCINHGENQFKEQPETVWPLYQDCVGLLRVDCYLCNVVIANGNSKFELTNGFYGKDFELPDWRELCV